jgi:hypothetical protein
MSSGAVLLETQEYFQMADRTVGEKKLGGEKKPGEKPSGKFHYNPGNMSGKEAEVVQKEGEPQADAGRAPAQADLVQADLVQAAPVQAAPVQAAPAQADRRKH